MYYKMYPALYVHPTFWPSDPLHTQIISEKFRNLQDAVNFAKQTHVCLREQNWFVYECKLFSKHRIPLNTLYDMGLFQSEIKKDNTSLYYLWK